MDPYLAINSEQSAKTLPAHFYTDPSILEREHELIFEQHWQLVGHVSTLQSIGDHIVCQVGRVPIIVIRNAQDSLVALHNVCRHRAGPLATQNGNGKVLRCRYHGWTYSLDGQLKSAPEMSTTPNFNPCEIHLPKAKVCQWNGFIFVSIKDAPPPIESYFDGIESKINPINLNQMAFSHRDEYLINCNWKVYMDNYLEGYHLPHVHPGLNKLLDYRSYQTQLSEWYSYQFSPLENTSDDSNNFYGKGQAHYFCAFPNLMLNILPARLQTNLILPVGVNQTRIIFDYYYSDLDSTSTQKLIKQDQAFSDQVQEEDISICEQVQIGLNSGSYQQGQLCAKRESGVQHFQNLIRRSLQPETA